MVVVSFAVVYVVVVICFRFQCARDLGFCLKLFFAVGRYYRSLVAGRRICSSKFAAELANGHFHMIAIIGMFSQDGCTHSAWGNWSV